MGYLGTIVYFLMYSSLAIVAWCILFIGPISDLLKGETIFTERLEIIDGNTNLKIHKISVKKNSTIFAFQKLKSTK